MRDVLFNEDGTRKQNPFEILSKFKESYNIKSIIDLWQEFDVKMDKSGMVTDGRFSKQNR